MGRLIDADANRDEFMEEVYDILSDEPDNIKANLIIDAFDKIPTAYDPDKVVEQLEEVEKIMTSPVNNDCFGEECRASDCTVCLISKAIEIVKGGGVDAKTDS